MGGYIDGRIPVQVTTLQASVTVETPYIQQASGANTLAVPDPANDDTLMVLSGVQTASSKTFLKPVITSGALTSPAINDGGTWAGAVGFTGTIALTGTVVSGGIMHSVVEGAKTVKTQADGTTKTLDFATADIFIVNLTQACTLTIANAASSKAYNVIVQQGIANSYTDMSWMTNFINPLVASGPTTRTGAIDFWQVVYDSPSNKHYAIGVKDIQT